MSIFTLILFAFFVIALFSWLLFSRSTMARIERELNKEGIKTAQWDGIGVRVITYAWTILFKDTFLDQKKDILIDNPAVNRHATPKDRILAGVVIVSSTVFTIGALVHFFQ